MHNRSLTRWGQRECKPRKRGVGARHAVPAASPYVMRRSRKVAQRSRARKGAVGDLGNNGRSHRQDNFVPLTARLSVCISLRESGQCSLSQQLDDGTPRLIRRVRHAVPEVPTTRLASKDT